jgi:lactoylglutathione lyase
VVGAIGAEPIAIMQHSSGVLVNLILNAARASTPNILMDVKESIPAIPMSRYR